MRIAMLAPISWATPPSGYGPWELVTSLLTEELVARGIDVTLFATLNSTTAGTLAGVAPRGYSEDPALDPKVWEALHIAHLFERAGEFDLIHNQFDFLPLAWSRLVATPVVTTIHGFSSPRILPAYRRYDGHAHYVAISAADRHPSLTYAATIHHGIRLDDFPAGPGGDELLFFGRFHPDKGAAVAIDAARAAGLPIALAGLIQDQGYWSREVEPRFGDDTRALGLVAAADRAAVLGRAKGLLHLIDFDEPFGLSVVEAMACGTPVIAHRRGSMPELIEDGVTGFLVDDVDGAVAAIRRLGEIDRAACRARARARFGVERMVDDYLRLYGTIIAGRVPARGRG